MDHGADRGARAARASAAALDHLGGGLYELRAKGQEGIGRALFVTRGERVIVVHAFQKKTQKTPAQNFRLAVKRAKETR